MSQTATELFIEQMTRLKAEAVAQLDFDTSQLTYLQLQVAEVTEKKANLQQVIAEYQDLIDTPPADLADPIVVPDEPPTS